MLHQAGEANRVLLYASEGLPRWQDWPANRPDLTERWFGPYEVNFNIYPNCGAMTELLR